MDFEEFKEKFTEAIKRIMDERLGGDTLVQGHAFDKTNYSYDALTVKPENSELGVNLDMTALYKDMEDMAVVYRFVLGQFPVGNGTILVTNKMLEQYGVSPEQLHQDAIKNAPEIRPMKIEGLGKHDSHKCDPHSTNTEKIIIHVLYKFHSAYKLRSP